MAYDNPIPGFDTYNTNNLRLWRACPSKARGLGNISWVFFLLNLWIIGDRSVASNNGNGS